MEEMGMSDLQFKNHLMELVDELERIKKLGVSKEAEEEIEKMLKRFRTTINS